MQELDCNLRLDQAREASESSFDNLPPLVDIGVEGVLEGVTIPIEQPAFFMLGDRMYDTEAHYQSAFFRNYRGCYTLVKIRAADDRINLHNGRYDTTDDDTPDEEGEA